MQCTTSTVKLIIGSYVITPRTQSDHITNTTREHDEHERTTSTSTPQAHDQARTHTFTHTRTHAHIHTYIHTYIYTYIHAHTHMNTIRQSHTHTHTHIHTYTHAHTCTRTLTHARTHTRAWLVTLHRLQEAMIQQGCQMSVAVCAFGVTDAESHVIMI